MIRSSVSFLFEFKSNLYYSMYWVIKLEKVNNKITKKSIHASTKTFGALNVADVNTATNNNFILGSNSKNI